MNEAIANVERTWPEEGAVCTRDHVSTFHNAGRLAERELVRNVVARLRDQVNRSLYQHAYGANWALDAVVQFLDGPLDDNVA